MRRAEAVAKLDELDEWVSRQTVLAISTSTAVVAALERLTESGLYGKTVAETAEEIIRERLRRPLDTPSP